MMIMIDSNHGWTFQLHAWVQFQKKAAYWVYRGLYMYNGDHDRLTFLLFFQRQITEWWLVDMLARALVLTVSGLSLG